MTTAAIAAFASRRREGVVNAEPTAIAVLDTLGVAVAGSVTEGPRVLTDWVTALPSVGATPLWGSGRQVAAPDAALVNGTAAHALDWDDAAPSMPIHQSTVLVPALLAQAAVTDVSGAALVEAFNVGASVFHAVSEALPVNASVARGWHNTATSGRLAAVAALANLTGLDTSATAHALGIAASMASGSTANFGTMTKPLHAGLAARDGLVAVSLAARGFTADATQLEGRSGFFAMYGEPSAERLAGIPDRLEHWYDAWATDWSIKRHPCCYGTHHAADAALELRDAVKAEEVERVDVAIYGPDLGILTVGRPTTGLEAKFSVEYVVAVALLRGEVTLADFEPDAVADPEVEALRTRVHITGQADAPSRFADMSITRRDGSVVRTRVDLTVGDVRRPMTADDVRAKFVGACASAGWDSDRAARAADALLSLPARAGVAALVAGIFTDPTTSERTEP